MKISNERLDNIFSNEQMMNLKDILNEMNERKKNGEEKYYPVELVLSEMEQIVKGANIEDFE